ncbi:hypothetical protein AAF712_006983 [Marasmius tenuissimus]|uniref:Uncharacterized protein n=1 Tax=Marasmius tenuissimus TaxID=585030 RepID=A0ABR2ZYX0_9AGAR
MLHFVFESLTRSLSVSSLSKWLNRVLHPPTVLVEEVPVLIPSRTFPLPPSRSLDVPLVNEGYDTLWQVGIGILVLVLFSSLALVSQKAWARQSLVFMLFAPVAIVVYTSPTLLDTIVSLDVVALSTDILDWLGLAYTGVVEWSTVSLSTSPNNVVGDLVSATARMADFLVFWSSLAASLTTVVNSLATIIVRSLVNISLDIARGHLAVVVWVFRTLTTTPLPTFVEFWDAITAYWTLLALESCMGVVTQEFMSSLSAHRAAHPNSLTRSKLLIIAAADAKKAFINWILIEVVLFAKFYFMFCVTLAAFIFFKDEDKLRFIQSHSILRHSYNLLSPVYRLSRSAVIHIYHFFSTLRACLTFMSRAFTLEIIVTLPTWKQIKAGHLNTCGLKFVSWDDSEWLWDDSDLYDRGKLGLYTKGGWYEGAWRAGHAWFLLSIMVGSDLGRPTP